MSLEAKYLSKSIQNEVVPTIPKQKTAVTWVYVD